MKNLMYPDSYSRLCCTHDYYSDTVYFRCFHLRKRLNDIECNTLFYIILVKGVKENLDNQES